MQWYFILSELAPYSNIGLHTQTNTTTKKKTGKELKIHAGFHKTNTRNSKTHQLLVQKLKVQHLWCWAQQGCIEIATYVVN